MKARPRRLVLLSVFLLFVTVLFPTQIMVLYGHTPWEVDAVLAKLAPMNWAVMLGAVSTAWLAFRASCWLMISMPTLIGLVIYNNWLVGSATTDYSMWVATIAVFLLAIGAFFVGGESLAVILNPQARWWLTPERKQMSVQLRLKVLSRTYAKLSQEAYREFYIKTFDLSEGGAFIPLEQDPTKSSPFFSSILSNLAVGTQCYVCLPLRDVKFIQCRAEIVRRTQGRGNYPPGVGLRFLGMTWSEKKLLQSYLDSPASVV